MIGHMKVSQHLLFGVIALVKVVPNPGVASTAAVLTSSVYIVIAA